MIQAMNKEPAALLPPPSDGSMLEAAGAKAPAAPPAMPEGLAKHGTKLVALQDFGLWAGLLAYDVPPMSGAPHIRWKGAKLKTETLLELAAFFRHANETWHSEAQARLFYSAEKGEWKVVVVPQRVATGMFSGELKDWQMTDAQKAMREAAFAEPGDGFQPNGTFHSHCDCSAFQSGTDHADEISQPGVHVTFGRVSSERIHVHGRVSFRGILYPIRWDDWLEDWPEGMNPDMQTFDLTVGKEFKHSFPAAWLERCFPFDSVPASANPDRRNWWSYHQSSAPVRSTGYGYSYRALPPLRPASPAKARKEAGAERRDAGKQDAWSPGKARRGRPSRASRKLERAVKSVYEATLDKAFTLWVQDDMERERQEDPLADLELSATSWCMLYAGIHDAVSELIDYGVPKGVAHAIVGKLYSGWDRKPAKAAPEIPADAARRLPQDGFEELLESDPDSFPYGYNALD